MAKVNLLPDYIWEAKRRKQTWALVALALITEIGALGLWAFAVQTNLREAQDLSNTLEIQANEVNNINQQAQAIQAEIQPIQAKTQYIEDVLEFNKKFPSLFERTNMYTYSRVGYRQLQPAQTVLNMSAYARNVSDIGRYLLNIQRARDTFTTVSITSEMPGWPAGEDSGGSAYGGGGYSSTGPAGPYGAPSTYVAQAGAPPGYQNPASASPYGAPPTLPGYGAESLFTTPQPAQPNVRFIDFTAVGQLTERYHLNPPTYQAGGAAADPYGAPGGAPTGPTGPYGAPPSSYGPPPGAGANGAATPSTPPG